jgi:hypothetical protein
MADNKQDPALYRVVETTRDADGRLVKTGRVWQPDLEQTRRFGRVLCANSVAQKVQVADEAGQILETIAPPPPGEPPQGWGDWRAQVAAQPALPVLPPRPPRLSVRRKALPVLPPESAVERTATLPPG